MEGFMNIWMQLFGYIMATMVFFYVPLQRYARRIESRFEKPLSTKIRLLTIGIAYLVWYPPIAFLLYNAWANDHFATNFNSLLCTVILLWSVSSFIYLEPRTSKGG